ncbi:Actin-binding FH2 [Artemisia annua]|uniref:Actin-binding FH2 n=1 Tax=Artemisia annua TaxID=35608 RepID=A0A2U1KN50_ARTAN|nr:Actin-binding FH2 [Artemisia annua]
MDRILKPGGRVYIRDSISVMDELEDIGKAIVWRVAVVIKMRGNCCFRKIYKENYRG